jgi:hypothetical protein
MADTELLDRPLAGISPGPRAAEGVTTAITVLTPIRTGGPLLERLVLFVAKHVPMLNQALVELSFIHYARWAIISEIPYNGAPQKRERLHYSYLLFETNFDGSWDEYIDAFAEVIPERMSAIWGTSFGFPGPRPVGPFKAYIHHNDLPIDHYYAAYPDATTKDVLAAIAVRDRFADFREQAARLSDPDEFHRAYLAFVTEIQHHL